eukprot:scaffold137489_cov16-Tisochrysis_lutea.AAC.1
MQVWLTTLQIPDSSVFGFPSLHVLSLGLSAFCETIATSNASLLDRGTFLDASSLFARRASQAKPRP